MVAVQPSQKKDSLLRKLVAIFILAYAFVQIFIVVNQHFDLTSILPLKIYRGESFSIGYLQNWKVLGQGDNVSIEPEFNWFTDFFDPPGYFGSSLAIITEEATAATSPAAGVIDEKVWEMKFPHYTTIEMPGTVIIGGKQWVQQTAMIS